jgi:hypothetical protein
MQDRRPARGAITLKHLRAGRRAILPPLRPALGPGHHPHPVWPQRVQPRRARLKTGQVQIGVARHLKMALHAVHQLRAGLVGIGRFDQRHRCLAGAILARGLERRRGDRFRDQPHTAMRDGVASIAFGGEGGVAARAPARPRPESERKGSPGRLATETQPMLEHGVLLLS